ncbi:MAG: hypothetical protein JKY52_16870 [Flavobacteriales bacterium]|nr:hypothetical protein [Flavobacteriales bacterium]
MNNQQPFYYPPLTRTQLARAYGVDLRTFKKWVKPLYKNIGKPNGRLFTPMQVNMIVQRLGRFDLNKTKQL